MVVVLDTTSTTMLNNMTQENTSLSTRRSVKFKGKDEEISDVEIDTAFIRGPALPGAAVRETANSEETPKYRVNTAFIRGPGARFSKLPVITGPVKVFCFSFQVGVSEGLKIVQ